LDGQPVCLNLGSYYNRALENTYGVRGQYFASRRESRLALLHDRCIAWAFDDTALAQLIRDEPSADFTVMEEAILVSPWAVIVAKSEGQGDLGRLVSDMIGEWHASGRIVELQDKWGIPRSEFVARKHAVWSETKDGKGICARQPDTGMPPDLCLDPPPVRSAPEPVRAPWVVTIKEVSGIDLASFANPRDRARLIRGLGLTLGLSAAAIAGALAVGIALGLSHIIFAGWGLLGQLLVLPQRLLVTVARMTPPILQLYIVFFGLGGIHLGGASFTPGGFLIAATILSFYAGSTNAVILSHALTQERCLHPDKTAIRLLPAALVRGYDGLVATCVNVVKAAGMASAIAVTELISTINLLVSEGADQRTMMNGLLVFYFLLVLAILSVF
jgi:polar amino acid transport system substrate-binding protein